MNMRRAKTWKLKNLNNSKSKWIWALKLSSVPTNVMMAVIFMVLLTSKLPSEAEKQISKKRLFALPYTQL